MDTANYVACPAGFLPEALRVGKVPTFPLTIDGARYRCLAHADFLRVCPELGLDAECVRLEPTAYEGIRRLVTDGTAATKPTEPLDPYAETRQAYARLCRGDRTATRLQQLRAECGKMEASITQLQAQYRNAVQHRQKLQSDIAALEAAAPPDDAQHGRDFDQLRQHPDIARIVVDGDTITVRTRRITILYMGVTYDIGDFEFLIHTQLGADRLVTVRNLTRTVEACVHPHVSSTVGPCWGNARASVEELAGERRWPALISLVIQFLKSYTRDDVYVPHRHITFWPKVPSGSSAQGKESL